MQHSSRRAPRLACLGAIALFAAPAIGMAGHALGQADAAPTAPGPILITLTNSGCQPNAIEAPAGFKSTFKIQERQQPRRRVGDSRAT